MPRRSLLIHLCLLASSLAATAAAEAPPAHPEPEDGETAAPKMVGFPLGEYDIKQLRPLENLTSRVVFSLYASVSQENEDEFRKLWPHYERRLRDQVVTVVRVTTPDAYDDPELKRCRQQFVLRLRRTLPELPIEDVYFGEFRYTID